MENIITALVIGKSGTGKSEFILSFIDEEQKKLIPSSGEGQTTRTSMKYDIDFKQKRDLSFEIEIKSKTEFVDERMAVVKSYFQKEENKLVYFKDNKLQDTFIEDLMNTLIFEEAFFSCKEFDMEDNEPLSEKIKDSFYNEFNSEFWKQCPDDLYQINENNVESDGESLRKFEKFLGETYDSCRQCIPLEKEKEIIVGGDESDIELYLKVNSEGKSFSSLIKNITITAFGTESYKDVMEKNKIDKLVLIDTFGLDHAEQMGNKMLEIRYQRLLRTEYPEVKSVFYLRNIAVPGSPSDLTVGISTLFKVEPSVVPYVIFTFWDQIFKSGLEKETYKETKEYKAIENIKMEIKKVLLLENISETLIDKRIKELLETRIAYASVIENKNEQEADELRKCNIENIGRILHSIRFEKYLGNTFIPIKLLELDKMKEVLAVDNLLKNRDLRNYPNATKGAIRKRIQRTNGRVLGFDSSTECSVLWTDILACDLNTRFCNVIANYNWKDSLISKVDECNYEEIIGTIQQLFVKLSKKLYEGATNSVDYLNTSLYGDLIIKSLYDEKKDKINSNVIGKVGEYLTNIYKFGDISDETKNKIQKIINRAYVEYYIPECRKHNARKMAERITKDTTWEQKEEMLRDYYSYYENASITEKEKIEFELLVSDNLTV